MGKEQELLEAARTGNLSAVERLLGGRRSAGGAGGGAAVGGHGASPHPLSSLLSIWRVPNVNCVDSTGYTPLHHAALNGHSGVVELLLKNDAVTTVADNKGCSPLHLAAWKGDQNIVYMLIHKGPSYPKLNEQTLEHRELKRCGPFDPFINAKNNDNETPLHCAAQYGHSEVVRVLLEELTDPTMRNTRFETPLDLAALYGRLEVVKLLLCAHPNLLNTHTHTHTPLHLAARNGHLQVVEVLLTAGMDINYQTDKGSALHEAALFGKSDVVQKLLSSGIDVNIKDRKNRTPLDVVKEMPSQKSRHIAHLIQAHMSGHLVDLPPPPAPPPQENLKKDVQQVCEESPYEALFEASSCHSLDSVASGKSSDRDSGRPESDTGRSLQKDRPLLPHSSAAAHDEEFSETVYTSSSMDERLEDDDDHTYETLSTARTKHPETQPDKDSSSNLLPQRKLVTPSDPPAPSSDVHTVKAQGPCATSRAPSGDPSLVPEQFTGLLHGSSPIIDTREGAASFRLLSDSVPYSSKQSVPMATVRNDSDPKAIYATVNKELRDFSVKLRPGDLKLTRSLSKSDSDLLLTPPTEEEAGLSSRSESVSNCSISKRKMEKSPSFTSEWDEQKLKGYSDERRHLHSSSSSSSSSIEKIMTLIGAGIEFSREPGSRTSEGAGLTSDQSVGDWLARLGLPQYESKLLLNGFDDLRFMGTNGVDEQDLKEIGILETEHRRKIIHASRTLPRVVGCESCVSLSSWLDSLGLSQYLHNFLKSGYNSLESLKNLWDLEIMNVLNISLLGHRKRILASLGERQYDEPPIKPPRLSQIKYPDVSQILSPPMMSDVNTQPSDSKRTVQEEKRCSKSQLMLRPPSQATPCAPVQNWHHKPEKLIFESCSYEANYLGSMQIKELRGIESTQDACCKMRRSTETMRKVPSIVLSITYKGVKFIDAASKNIIAEHEIRNISCAAQDPEDLCTFAYITKDLQTDHHYCHVFSTADVNLTYEIILTLGQAFEVAYQLALQAQRTGQKASTRGGAELGTDTNKSSRPVPKPRVGVRTLGVDDAAWLNEPKDPKHTVSSEYETTIY